jgi:hypothetical protein
VGLFAFRYERFLKHYLINYDVNVSTSRVGVYRVERKIKIVEIKRESSHCSISIISNRLYSLWRQMKEVNFLHFPALIAQLILENDTLRMIGDNAKFENSNDTKFLNHIN